MHSMPNAPAWVRRTLIAAGVYNLIWGAAAILAPISSLKLLGLTTPPAYPEFWQCIGMIVGVYGVGYLIASRHPYVHWPIVLVGFLGKLLGPVGFLGAVMRGTLPVAMGWTILLNDLIWWIPFAAILWQAAKAHQGVSSVITAHGRAIDPMGRLVSQYGSTVRELSRRQPLMLVFLRHSGCTFCRQALSDLAEQRAAIEANGVQIALVHMGQHEPVDLLVRNELTDLHCFRDPQCVLYQTFGLPVGGPLQLFGPRVLWSAIRAWTAGHGIGRLAGDAFRLGGVFLLRNGELLRARKLKSADDRPDYAAFSRLPSERSLRETAISAADVSSSN